jgi:menaquinone-dependent protoporphyrinogen oxidase
MAAGLRAAMLIRMSKLLVAYASKHGSTAEIAGAIAEELRDSGVDADLVEVGKAPGLEAYDGVVLGSAVYMKRWQRGARQFLHRLEHDLGDQPLWIFSSGPVGDAEVDPNWCEPAKTLRRAQQLNLRDHVIFSGRVPQDPVNFVERAMLKNTPPEMQDRRDFDEIRGWARQIAASVTPIAL